MSFIWNIIYNYLVIPFLYIALQIGSLFNKKIRFGISGRKRVYENLILSSTKLDKRKKLVWFHSSSLGEFEQAKPIIEKLKKEIDINILITFFSPSGYENSRKYPYADLISYIPFDTKSNAEKFLNIVRPSISIIMRYDVWPNMINALNKKNIPIFLVDATLRSTSPRKYPFLKSFHKNLFDKFSRILTVSETDAAEFISFGLDEKKIAAVGDTRFDRVYQRSIIAREKKLIKEDLIANKKVFVAGSTWEQDEEVLFPAFLKLSSLDESVLLIIAPHEPTILHLEKIEHEFSGKLKTIRFSHLNNYADERVIIVDSIGILLTLYTYADAAYVGGGFKQNIHNVLEAAVYGIPVMYGPKIQNSQEAQKLTELGGGILINNKREAYRYLRKIFSADNYKKTAGKISSDYVRQNTGATEKIINEILKVL
jgi:3-deoxy-D-manno-octulosonic-acid transferase